MWHDLTAKGFARFLTVVYATPTRRGECRLFARFPFRFASPIPRLVLGLRPTWLQHIANHTVLEDDQVFLHWQERALAQRGGSAAFTKACFLPTAADVYVRALHDWVNRYGGEPFPDQPLPPLLGRGALMDRYGAHTAHCHACAGALRRIRLLKRWFTPALWLVLLAMLWVHSSASLGVGLAVAAALLLVEQQLSRWETQLLIGDGHPPRNALTRTSIPRQAEGPMDQRS
jgi:hypothetical protein